MEADSLARMSSKNGDSNSTPAVWAFRAVLLAALSAAVLVAIVAVLRRRKDMFARGAEPYFRRSARPSKPALIVNRWSGGGKAEQFGLSAAAEEAGIHVVLLEPGDDIVQLATDAVAGGADAIGAAGGDGSLGLVAGVAVESDVPFFCVPVGTRNHFALDLGLDRDNPLDALAAITDGEELMIDIGMAGDRPFLNNVSFGIYAEAVHRAEYRDNKEQTLAQVADEFQRGEDSAGRLRFAGPDGGQAERVAMTLVSNNPYLYSGPPDFGRRTTLDSGSLGISAAGEGKRVDGRSATAIKNWEAPSLTIDADGPIKAGLDGEAVEFVPPLELCIRARALRVLVPRGTRPGYKSIGQTLRAGLDDLVELAGIPSVLK